MDSPIFNIPISVSATQKSDEVRPVEKKKKKKLPDEVRPDEVHPGSGKNGWGEGPGYIVKWTRWGAAPQGTHPTPYRKIKASPLWRRADLRPHLWYPPLSFPWHPLSPTYPYATPAPLRHFAGSCGCDNATVFTCVTHNDTHNAMYMRYTR